MKKLAIFLTVLLSTALLLQKPVFAASTAATQSGTVTTNATIRGNTFTVSGFTSPFASVVITTSGQFLISTTADTQGNFSAPVTIPVSTTALCLDALDFKRLGQSQACIDTTTTNPIGLFLPPTIGLLSTTIDAGQNATIYGYSLPRSTVIINSEGKIYTTTTDDAGYYAYTIESIPAGTFVFSALGEVLGAQSLPPTGGVELKALSLFEQASTTAQDVTQSLTSITTSYLVPILLTILFLIICILVFLYIKKRKKKEQRGRRN
jgi:preprotein translocase subunit SecG